MENRVRSVDLFKKCIWLMDGIQLTADGTCHLNLSLCDFQDRAKSVILCD